MVTKLCVVLALLHLAMSVSALDCYICNRLDGEACRDPINKALVRTLECSHIFDGRALTRSIGIDRNTSFREIGYMRSTTSDRYQCVTLETLHKKDNSSEVIRTCIKQSENFCAEQTSIGNIYGFDVIQCKICDGDRCNGAGTYYPSILLALIITPLLIYSK